MYSMKTIEYLMLKQKKMSLTERTIIFEVSVRCFFTNETCNEMIRWISLINKLFSDISISQGSAATRLRCGEIFNECCIANFLEIITVKELLKSANI